MGERQQHMDEVVIFHRLRHLSGL